MMQPTEIKLSQKDKRLTLTYEDGSQYNLSCEFLRLHSPSAEVQGHVGQPVAPLEDKSEVNIVAIEPVGQYAVKLIFDDGHDTGLYTWELLYQWCLQTATTTEA